jgi:hypothetical protein
MLTESEARVALKRMGYRLSQYNQGYKVLDAEHRYVGPVGREMSLEEISDWIKAQSGAPAASAERLHPE